VNRFADASAAEPEVFPIDPALEASQRERVRSLKAARDGAAVAAALGELTAAARGSQNVLYPMREALRVRATLGEVADALREVFGVYQPA
jgi:methylmalonyl-CoA mutase N-terminal domain/subunit